MLFCLNDAVRACVRVREGGREDREGEPARVTLGWRDTDWLSPAEVSVEAAELSAGPRSSRPGAAPGPSPCPLRPARLRSPPLGAPLSSVSSQLHPGVAPGLPLDSAPTDGCCPLRNAAPVRLSPGAIPAPVRDQAATHANVALSIR